MIKSITVTNESGERLYLDITKPYDTGFLVGSITGLGPVKANINTTEVITNDGSLFNSARLNQRNIVITFGYLPVPTVEDVRQLSYKYFPIKKRITLEIETDNRKAVVEGYVESNEPQIFSKQEAASISIICPKAFFKASEGTEVHVFRGVTKLFEFPFENEDPVTPMLELGNIEEKTQQNIFYTGDSDVGMTMYIKALGEIGDIIIYNVRTREQMRIMEDRLKKQTGSGLVYGDEIIINTNRGEKGLKLFREGVETNILNCLDKGTSWLQLTKGDNLLAYSASRGGENLEFRIENDIIYEGI